MATDNCNAGFIWHSHNCVLFLIMEMYILLDRPDILTFSCRFIFKKFNALSQKVGTIIKIQNDYCRTQNICITENSMFLSHSRAEIMCIEYLKIAWKFCQLSHSKV